MLISSFIYFNIGVCILLILFEVSWRYYIKIHDKKILKNKIKYKNEIEIQLNYIKDNEKANIEYFNKLKEKLKHVNNLISYERAFNEVLKQNKKEEVNIDIYIEELLNIFNYLSMYYLKRKNNMEKAYLAYVIGNFFKYIEDKNKLKTLICVLYKLMESKYSYCRINAIEAIYKIGNTRHIIRAISIINKNKYKFNEDLLAEGLKSVKNDKEKLKQELFKKFNKYNKNIKLAIIKFAREGVIIE